jgi:hypothetical protein
VKSFDNVKTVSRVSKSLMKTSVRAYETDSWLETAV